MAKLHLLLHLLFLNATLVTLTIAQSTLDGLINIIDAGERQIGQEPPERKQLLPEYDFIVIGAGTAGCVVANRLSENPNWNVLLIEAGRPENYLMDMPMIVNYLQFTESNWRYMTEPSGKFCMGMDNGQCHWPRGKVIGGSSVLNYMIYTRGNKRDYDRWAKNGNTGWSYDEVLPYFKKIENFQIPEHQNSSYHGTDGYLTVSYSPFKTKIIDSLIEASKQSGFPEVDYNGATQVGVSRLQLTMKNGVRDSSSRAYLHPIGNRKNLHVKKYSMVSKLLINPTTKQVEGVEFVRGNKTSQVRVSKEVILSAGAINTPQLLMLSGIGPRKHLKQLGIPVISNLRVGHNLQDHMAAGGLIFLIDKPYSLILDRLLSRDSLVEYLNYRKGPLSIPGGCEGLVFADLDNPGDPNGYPDMELLILSGSLVSDPVLYKNFGITQEIFDAVYKPIYGRDTFMIFPMLMRPKSRGRIMLKSADYRDKAKIFPNYFADSYDLKTIVKGIHLAINITKQPAMKQLNARLHDIPIPQCSNFKFGSDEYFECMTRYITFTIYHHSGTCKMGPASDKRAVVDPRLRVYGVKGLRVMDASVLPDVPTAHTNAPTYMVAEKGSDMVKEDWGFKLA